MKRRDAVRLLGAAALSPQAEAWARHDTALKGSASPSAPRGAGRLKQSVCRWPFSAIPLPDLCRAAVGMGLTGIDLLYRDDWERVREFGLVCSMGYPPSVDRRGRSDAPAIDACVAGLTRVKALAEEQGVTICLELLNSKVDHADYQGDRTAFGVRVVQAVGSPRVKLLYDIYHMQIMEGDVIATIRANAQHIAHFHTGGVPGRNEIDDTQELNYRRVMQAIADLGFTGYVAQEFVPKRDPLTSMRQAFEICDV